MSDVTFYNALKTDQLDEDEAIQVIIEGKEVAIINLGGEFYAMDDICSHAYASMADGYLEGECLECPLVALILTNLLKAVFLVTFSPHDLPSLLIQR